MGNSFRKYHSEYLEDNNECEQEEIKESLQQSLQICKDRIQLLQKQANKSESLLKLLRATCNQHRIKYEKEQERNEQLINNNKELVKENAELVAQISIIEDKLESIQFLFK